MNIKGSELLPIASDLLRPLLMDAGALRRILPGCKALSAVAPDEYRIEIQQRVGPYNDLFSGLFSLTPTEGSEGLAVLANLESANGLVHIEGSIEPDQANEANTLLRYQGTVDFGGRLAVISPRLLETTTNAFIRRMLEALERETAGPLPATYPPPMNTSAVRQSDQSEGLNIPGWAVALLMGLGVIVFFRLLDNQRIDRLGQGQPTDHNRRSDPG